MTFCLDSTIIKPENNNEIQSAIILLHGYGGDGKDISMLSLNWKRHLPNTVFICPNGHEQCSINPTGFQWFDLTKDDSKYILEEVVKAEKKLNQFIEEVKEEFGLKNNKICLSGFSQGCMMSINLGLTAEYATNLTVIINQGATPYEVTAVQIGGAAQTINWQGGSQPTGNANGIDSFSFTLLNDGGTYVVLGQMVDFT